jgi:hypothetical protein
MRGLVGLGGGVRVVLGMLLVLAAGSCGGGDGGSAPDAGDGGADAATGGTGQIPETGGTGGGGSGTGGTAGATVDSSAPPPDVPMGMPETTPDAADAALDQVMDTVAPMSCQTGLVDCGGACIDPLSSRQFCGATAGCGVADAGSAGTACTTTEICSGGACKLSCQTGLVECGGICIDPANNRQHCGATAGCGVGGGSAGTVCPAGQVCSNGLCQLSCQSGLVNCGGTCVDPQTSRVFCGASGLCGMGGMGSAGSACTPGQVCSGGTCQLSCQMGLIDCDGTCVDPQSSRLYCGATGACGKGGAGSAGTACPVGLICSAGSCKLSCQMGLLECGGKCIDPQTNRQYCGATAGCGVGGSGSAGTTCPTGQVCTGGSCQLSCQMGLVNCGGTCVDPQTSRGFCGATTGCGVGGMGSAGAACSAGQVCSAGTGALSCQAGLINCNGTCVDPKSSRLYCGATGACGAGGGSAGTACTLGQVCSSGTCALSCQAGLVNCGGTCIDPQTSRQFCGAVGACGTSGSGSAGTACTAGKICSGGACQLSCQSGLINCGGTCIDPQTSRSNCGATAGCGVLGMGSAGMACSAGQVCSAGTCQLSCQSGLVNCGGTCVDPQTSRSYCGASGACGSGGSGSAGSACGAGQVCSGGSCALSCQSGLVDCGGTCIDPQTSRAYCGATGNCTSVGAGNSAGAVCAAGQICASGTCVTSCPSGSLNCGGTCINPSTDNGHCGASGDCTNVGMGNSAGTACGAGQVCSGGTCGLTCQSGLINCGGTCVDPQTSRSNCGATGDCTSTGAGNSAGAACSPGEICTAGSCVLSCQSGLIACSSTCVSTASNPAHCGGCGNACSSTGIAEPTCFQGSCNGACGANQGDCNANKLSDGCETNLQTSTSHCGACGAACTHANVATPVAATCTAGACVVTTCAANYGNCDSNNFNGCEVDNRTSVSHCGGCGNACSSSGITTPNCAAGVCNGSCDTGYADCNTNKLTDGCEINLTNNASNCGACGTVCTHANVATPVAATCTASACVVTACTANHGNCDSNNPNGCETNTGANASHCGACNNACAGGEVCTAGICTTAKKKVFVTSTTTTGNLGGLAGADAICAARASAAGLPGTYKAWLSDATTSVATRFAQAAVPYVLLDGTQIAADWTALTSGTIQHAIDVDETGATITGPVQGAYTNTTAAGNIASAVETCTDWTVATGGSPGIGAATATNGTWTTGTTSDCVGPLRLYCFEQ